MKPSEAFDQLVTGYQARIPVMLWGPVGVGKSTVQRAVCEALNLNMIDQRISQMDPTDLKGIPYQDNGYTRYAIPDFLPQVDRDGPAGVLFLDEINTGTQAMQAASYQLILDRRLGDYVLPDGWVVNGAGNRASDRAIAIRTSSALSNRFKNVDFELDNPEWHAWARENQIDPIIRSFIDFKPDLLHEMSDAPAFPTPRTWEMLHKHIPFMTDDNDFNTACSIVGKGAGSEFVAYRRVHEELPTRQDILDNPGSCKIPEKLSAKFAVSAMMANGITVEDFPKALKYVCRIDTEYQVVFIRNSMLENEDVADTKAFTEWNIENHSVVL